MAISGAANAVLEAQRKSAHVEVGSMRDWTNVDMSYGERLGIF